MRLKVSGQASRRSSRKRRHAGLKIERTIVCVEGKGTTKVGDPSDKTSQRPLLTDEVIAANIAGIKQAFAPFLRKELPHTVFLGPGSVGEGISLTPAGAPPGMRMQLLAARL